MKVSFGIEIEFDSVQNTPYRYVSLGSAAVRITDDFACRPDCTAGTEVASPVFVDVKNAAQRLSRFFSRAPDAVAPVLMGHGPIHPSLGQHIHIGIPERSLSSAEKRAIARHAKMVYPFLTALHANDRRNGYVSHRGEISQYCYAIGNDEIVSSHYGEISDSHVGTVEFRKFDSNIPQVSLTCATILKVVALGALRGKTAMLPFERFDYPSQMKVAVKLGVEGLNVGAYIDFIFTEYAEEWAHIMATESIPDCVWEVLHLVTVHKKTVSDIAQQFSIYGDPRREFEYFRLSTENCETFFSNFHEDLVRDLVGVYAHNITPAEIPDLQNMVRQVLRTPRETPRVNARYVAPEQLMAADTYMHYSPAQRIAVMAHLHNTGMTSNMIRRHMRDREVQVVLSSLEWECYFAERLARAENLASAQQTIEYARRSARQSRELAALWRQHFDTLAAAANAPATQTLDSPAERLSTAQSAGLGVYSAGLGVYRLGSLSPAQLRRVSEITGMTYEQLREHHARFYASIVDSEVQSVAEVHVNCTCSPGLIRTFGVLDSTLDLRMERLITYSNRTPIIERSD